MKKQKAKLLSFSLALCLAGGALYVPTYAHDVAKTNKGGVVEHIQSFEGKVPENWKATNDKLEISNKHFKNNKHALKWNWDKGDKLVATHEENMVMAGKTEHGGIIAWVYNEKPIQDKMTVNLGTKDQIEQGNPLYTFEFNLNFEGWRALWIDFKDDAVNEAFQGERIGDIEQIEIIAPENTDSGELYFDLVEFVNNLHWCRSQDYQFPIQRANSNGGLGGTWERSYYYINQEPHIPLETLTQEQIDTFDVIEKRLDDWVYGTGKYQNQEPMKIRKDALDAYIKEGIQEYEDLQIVKHPDGSITGVPLFASRSPYIKMGKQFGSDVSTEIFLPLVFDYKLNGNKESLEKLMTLFDYYYDQGWAEGSGLGTPDHETNRSSGYFVAVYLMRDELKESGRYDREIGAMNWYTDFGKVFGEYKVDYTETTADEMRTHFLYRLLYVMAMEDSPEKVQAMRSYLEWVDSALEINPNFAGTIKPDYTGFHHRGIYMSAYAPHGYHLAAAINYLLHDTMFEFGKESQNNLKQALITLDVMTNKDELPLSLMGRFPQQVSQIGAVVLPAYAYMALSGDPITGEAIDKEMAGIFVKNWDAESAILKKDLFRKSRAGISYVDTLGGMELMIDLVESGIQASPEQEGFWSKPYGGFAVQRQDKWMALVKGWSQYVWDYESGGSNKENDYGRYMSYGTLQILANGDPSTAKSNGFDYENGWDWNRLPGATTKHLPLEKLTSETNNYAHRTFSDQIFLGSVTNENKEGVWAMSLHDTQYDTSFYAKKSVFFFEDEMVCLGSDIKNTDAEHETETTLFQSNLNNDTTMPFYLNSKDAITQYPFETSFEKEESVWMMDPYGNGYYLPNAASVKIARGTQNSKDAFDKKETKGEYTTAWIDHGKAPEGKGYEYVIKPQTTPEEMEKYSENINYEVLQQDENAHIVKHEDANKVGYAIFEANKPLPKKSFIQKTDTPILAMVKEDKKEVVLSISDPDLRLPKLPNQTMDEDVATIPSIMKKARIEVEGKWQLKEANKEVRVLEVKGNTTVIEFDCIDGKTLEVELVKGK